MLYRKPQPTLMLSGKDVRTALTMRAAIDSVEEAFKHFALNNVVLPERVILTAKHTEYLIMPSYIGGCMDTLGIKILTSNMDNPRKHSLPWTLAVVQLNDPNTGEVIAIIEGTVLTAIRTAALSGVATRYLARKDAETVGMFGAGYISRDHLRAMCEVRKIKKAKVIDILAPEKCRLLCREMGKELGIHVIPVDDPKEAVKGADIICTITTSLKPVFKGKWLEEGVHINSVGAVGPKKGTTDIEKAHEIDNVTIKRVRKPIVVDLKRHILKEAPPDIAIPISKGLISEHDLIGISDLIIERKYVRLTDKDITLFKTQGVAIQDIAVAKKTYDSAKSVGVGKYFQF